MPSPLKIELRSASHTISIEIDERMLGRCAIEWTYDVHHRRRWADPKIAANIHVRARQKWAELNVSLAQLRELGDGPIEVSIPFEMEDRGWSARIMPWEFLFREALQAPDLVVIRHLKLWGAASTKAAAVKALQAPGSGMFVESAPPPLDAWNFEVEKRLVEESLATTLEYVPNPTLDKFISDVGKSKPELIHLSAVDTRGGNAMLRNLGQPTTTPEGEDPHDGIILASPTQGLAEVSAQSLSFALSQSGAKFVALNVCNSAARIAPLLVGMGCDSAFGFQDVMDDALAESFFVAFYKQWRETNSLLKAFQEASRATGRGTDLGIVLWSRHSLLGTTVPAKKTATTRGYITKRRKTKGRPFEVNVVPNPEVNYSLLHNGEGLFQKFSIHKFIDKEVSIEVEVNLQVGDRVSYRRVLDLKKGIRRENVSTKIVLPLTSRFFRTLRESIFTNMEVIVRHGNTVLYCDSHRVQLLAINEWRFDRDRSTKWLASFVLNLDPAVGEVVDAAQKYLIALSDDSGAGFDGYQSDEEGVENQVRAIWSALSFEIAPSYINPPPVFQDSSQRLRTPSDVIQAKRGTCIDLALLFAACLEYVDIYPVVFLLSDHAFPGFWTSQAAYDRYSERNGLNDGAQIIMPSPQSLMDQDDIDSVRDDPGQLRRQEFREIRGLIDDGSLIPLETVWLTSRKSFREAIEAGGENLISSDNYEAMLDVKRARDSKPRVTPLPILGDPA